MTRRRTGRKGEEGKRGGKAIPKEKETCAHHHGTYTSHTWKSAAAQSGSWHAAEFKLPHVGLCVCVYECVIDR